MSQTPAWWRFGRAWIGVLGLVLLSAGVVPDPAWAQEGEGTITGTVVDAEDGRSLVGATVVLRGEDGTSLVERTTTESDGTFQFSYLSPGEYVLEIRFVGYEEEQRPLLLEMRESRDVRVELETEKTGFGRWSSRPRGGRRRCARHRRPCQW